MGKTVLWTTPNGDQPVQFAFKNNITATTAPSATDDSSKGYEVGSSWINQTTDTAYICVDATVGAAIWGVDGQGTGLGFQGAPSSQDTAATLTAAQLIAGILTSAPAAAINLQLPLATAMDTALPAAAAGMSFDFSLVNTSTTAANTDTITTNTGWTLVGNMVVPGATAGPGTSGRFRARKTGTGAWTLYRLS